MIEQHAVFASLSDGTRIRLTHPGDYTAAVTEWYRLDDLRRAGHEIATERHRPVATASNSHGSNRREAREAVVVRHFVVRDVNDPQWADSAARMGSLFLLSKRGYAKVENAGRAFARSTDGQFRGGSGGWIRNRSGQPVVQGWFQFATAYAGLAKVDGEYRFTIKRFHADWCLGRESVDA